MKRERVWQQTWLHTLLVLATIAGAFSAVASEDNPSADPRATSSQNEAPHETPPGDESPFHGRGFVRQFFDGLRVPEGWRSGHQNFYSSVSTLRLEGTYEKDNLRGEISGNASGIFTSRTSDPTTDYLWAGRTRNRAVSAESIQNDGNLISRLEVHRMFVAYRSSEWNITFGRQAISWGEGRFLNPMDLITPVGPFLYDIEDVAGADAVSVQYFFNQHNSLQFVAVPLTRSDNRNLKEMRSNDTNALLRFKATSGNLDYVFVGGQHYHSIVWGTEETLSAFDATFRFAYLGRSLEPSREYEAEKNVSDVSHQFMIGMSYAFLGGKLRTSEELLINTGYTGGDGFLKTQQTKEAAIKAGRDSPLPDDTTFFITGGRILTRNPYLLQGSIGRDLADVWKMDLILLYDIYGKSALYGPQLTYNFSDEGLAVLGGRFYLFSRDTSVAEFQGGEPEVFTYVRLYF